MAMRACEKCLENNWTFEKLNVGDILATCENCGYEVQWTPKPKQQIKEGSRCRHCKTKIILKEARFKKSKLKKPYYYVAYYYCPNCKAMYMNDKFKIFTGEKKKKAKLPVGYIFNKNNKIIKNI